MCDVGPPSVVTSASTLSRSSSAVSAGARSFATSTNGCPGSGTPGAGHAAQPRDDALGDVVEVGRALAEVAAERGQLVAERRERVEHRPLAGPALREPGRDLVGETRVLGHHRLRLEHVLGGAAGLRAALLELARDGGDGLAHAGRLLVGGQRARRVARRRQRLRHPGDRPLGDASPIPTPRSSVTPTSVIVYSASWSVVSSSARVSSAASAPSPSAVSVT